MKIYTKTGDKGTTSLIGGERVPKNHERLNAYGTVDELISFIGLLRDHEIGSYYRDFLTEIQSKLMSVAAYFAASNEQAIARIPAVSADDITSLESEIDRMESTLKPLMNFILPGGHPVVSLCHICRTICRRAEREAYRIPAAQGLNDLPLMYLNRLSDFFFVLARKFAKDFNATELAWNKNLPY